jgi:hypothetical protein
MGKTKDPAQRALPATGSRGDDGKPLIAYRLKPAGELDPLELERRARHARAHATVGSTSDPDANQEATAYKGADVDKTKPPPTHHS